MNNELIELSKRYKAVRERYAELEKEKKLLDDEWVSTEQRIMELMVDEGVSSIKIDGVGAVGISTKVYLNVKNEMKPKFFEYLKATGNDSILKLDVHRNTLGAFLKSHLAEIIMRNQQNGSDEVEARERALEELKPYGVGFFEEKTLGLRKE